MKRFAPDKVNTGALISKVKQGFKIVLKRPALRNLILVMLASLRTTTFRINTLAAHLPVLVAHYKTKQKRLLRFINSNFPTDVALVAWCRFVLCWLYNKIGQAPRIVLVDETDILEHYRVIVMAVPFRIFRVYNYNTFANYLNLISVLRQGINILNII